MGENVEAASVADDTAFWREWILAQPHVSAELIYHVSDAPDRESS